ncbi:hypothetical protein FEE95_04830 [Maribacter algarum]|uniref:Uncharacterized protein n=1 Tax=Maribacter algarum (ex Zhang et al. 2020) TaxID=2578118 RepID=A0A5S3PUT3_9FLAO|nr:hypothetical protein [Maribacter algarum]TMM58759.1 hypothetical protein FEE95_04830 [Maribacter algarum]
MPHIFSKAAKLVLWVLLPTLFISGTKLNTDTFSKVNSDEDYTLRASGNLNNSLNGTIRFETSVVTTSKGISFSVLKLKLESEKSLIPHSMEFLISEKESDSVLEGTHKVSNNNEGLLNYFDGVFGFANINALGELPLFAKSGEIQIEYLDETNLKGVINIQMSNAIGKSVKVKGNFVATK